jgi:DNA-binding NtrC family response regulator
MAEVLLLTDDQMVGTMLRETLDQEGHRVVAVEEGEHALIQLRATLHPVVAILIDRTPNPTLAELLTTIHTERQELAPHAYIAVTSSLHSQLDAIPQVLADLDVSLLIPPYDLDRLLAEVSRLAARFPERWR